MTEEIWKAVKGYEGIYEVSNLGRVKSVERMVKHWRGGFKKNKARVLRCNFKGKGYPNVTLSKNNNQKQYTVHQLVAINFLNHKPCGTRLVVDHIDDNPLNNRVDNLRVVTTKENVTKNGANLKNKSRCKKTGRFIKTK